MSGGVWVARFVSPTVGFGAWPLSGTTNPSTAIMTASDAMYSQIRTNVAGSTVGWYGLATISGAMPAYCSITTMYAYFRFCRTGSSSGTGLIAEYNGAWHTWWSGTWPPFSTYYKYTTVGWTRAQALGMYMYAHHYGNGDGTKYIRADYCRVYFTWAYYAQSGHDITSFTGIDTEGATVNMKYNAGGDGDTEWYMEWGNAPGSYQHSAGWTTYQTSGTGWQYPTWHITGEAPNSWVYVRFRTRNCGNTDVVFCPEHSFKTLGGGASVTGGLILGG